MKNRVFGIFAKVFSYTIIILLIIICVAAAFFSNQIAESLNSMEHHQLINIFDPLVSELSGKQEDEIVQIAENFHQKNSSFEFILKTMDGKILYKTDNADVIYTDGSIHGIQGVMPVIPIQNIGWGERGSRVSQITEPLPNGVSIIMAGTSNGQTVYNDFIIRTIIVLLILFVIGALCAAWFAYRFTKPIKTLALDTRRMAGLEFVPPPVARRDEIGQLAKDVYKMYEELKTEIEREREMEESQRYFFSAASHELKTPISSALILLQGMRDNIDEYKDHPKYLLECIKKLNIQSKMITEILEIVRLSDGRIIPNTEETELSGLVESVLNSHQTLSESKELTIKAAIPADVFCEADGKMLDRVLSNVLLNAIQNTPERGEIEIYQEEQDNKTIRLSVLNMGENIDEEALGRVFEPFYREDKARSSGQGRSGLGLAIVKKTLDCMEIPFALENTKNAVCFWMDLPVKKVSL